MTMDANEGINIDNIAEAYMEAGFIVIPIAKGIRHPDYQGWADAANTQQAMRAFKERHGRPWDDDAFQVRMPSKWICLDIDRHEDVEEIDAWMSPRHPDDWFGNTIRVHTPSGGMHVYIQLPDGRKRSLRADGPNLIKRVLNLGKGNPQIEVEIACSPKAKGSYGGAVMAPGSRFRASEKCVDKQRRRGIPKAERAKVGDELVYEPANFATAEELANLMERQVSPEFAQWLADSLVFEDAPELREYNPKDPITFGVDAMLDMMGRIGLVLKHETRLNALLMATREGYKRADDSLILLARERIVKDYKITFSASRLNENLLVASNPAYDRADEFHIDLLKDWLDGINPAPSGAFAETWTEVMGVDDTPYNRWVSAAIILGVVQKIYEPESLIRVFPTLVGPHSAGKSSTVGEILPPEFRRMFFTSSVNFAASNEELAYLLEGRVLAEFPEMTGMARKEIGAIKAWTTEKVRHARAKYEKNPRAYVAGTHFVATANSELDFLPNDRALASRFPIIYVDRYRDMAPVDWWAENRERLFASAKRLYLDGMRLDDIPREFRREIDERSSSHRFMNESIRDALFRIKSGSAEACEGMRFRLEPGDRGMTCVEIIETLDMKGQENNLRNALKNDPSFDCTKTRRGMVFHLTEEAWAAVPEDSAAKNGGEDMDESRFRKHEN